MSENGERWPNCFHKRWPTVLSTNRNVQDERPYGDMMKLDIIKDDDGKDSFSIFLWDSQGSAPCKIEEIEEYVQGATIETLMAGDHPAGHLRNAWIWDNNSVFLLDEKGIQENGIMTATGVHRRLLHPRFHTQCKPRFNIRLVHIRNLDPHSIIALGTTASFEQVSLLRDAFWKHLALQTSIRIKIPSKLGIFQMELHLPYFALRALPVPEISSQDSSKNSFRRRWTDISFLNIPPPESDEPFTYGLYESQMAFVICGSDEKRWCGYSFVDADPDDDESLEDLVSPCTLPIHACVDPITNEVLEGNLEITDPREYWLKVFQKRMEDILKEWELIVRKFEQSITKHQRDNSSTLVKDALHGHQAEDVKKTFDWNQQTKIVLNHVLDVLRYLLKTWGNFSSRTGDIGYFSAIDTSPNKPHSGIELSLQAINDTIETLEGLKDKLELLVEKCRNSAEDLQLRLTLEANEAVRNNGDFTHFTVSIISPVMVAIAYFSIPKDAAPFKLDTRLFYPGILLIGLLVQVLFIAFRMRPLWSKKAHTWAQKIFPDFEKLRPLWVRERSREIEAVGAAV